MSTRSKRLPPSVAVKKSALEQTTALLQQLPEKTRDTYSLKEAIATLTEPITEALDKGYSYEEISALLSEKKIAIAPTSLRYYLASLRRNQKSENSSSPKKTRKLPAKKSVEQADSAAPDRSVSLKGNTAVDEVISYLLDEQDPQQSSPTPEAAPTKAAVTAPPAKKRGRSAANKTAEVSPAKALRKPRAKAKTEEVGSAPANKAKTQSTSESATKRVAKRTPASAKTTAKSAGKTAAPKSTTRGRKKAS